ncbi:hypothetical protein CAPTEDRAFT_214208 [Capitella teleta]|uniref:Chitin-binding type-2 domain-containing protein n=1 Tax=Capitella teleta TaxID=283909 RepID=R7VH44_CAPTE|nr:hypothetical protein CAPTEDRAFT_214208 [Capitella teleta]|eukprot:ELU17892.1 hypothetical protein CAPTEDRAFT_214208 [Capitella teleta]
MWYPNRWVFICLLWVTSLAAVHLDFDVISYCRIHGQHTSSLQHPYSCSKYIVCANGIGYIQQCSEGMSYDPRRGICDHKSNVACYTTVLPKTNPKAHYGLMQTHALYADQFDKHHTKTRSDPDDVTEGGDRMVHVVHEAPDLDDVFRKLRYPSLTRVEHERRDGESTQDPPTEICERDGLYPNPNDCKMFIQCIRGIQYERFCPAGTYFDSDSKNCGYNQAQCSHDNTKSSRLHGAKSLAGFLPTEIQDIISKIEAELSGFVAESEHRTELVHRQEARKARDMPYSSNRPFSGVQSFLGSTPYVKQLSIPAYMQLNSLQMIRNKFELDLPSLRDVMNRMPSFLTPSVDKVYPDMVPSTPSMGVCPYPINTRDNDCHPYHPYRTYDGSCNNLDRPLWGKSMRALARFLPAEYSDGIQAPRLSMSGRDLPGARHLSLNLFEEVDHKSPVHTMMLMTYGQFLDHDLSRSAVTKLSKNESGDVMNNVIYLYGNYYFDPGTGEMVDVMCGESECETFGPENRACMPIPLARPYDPDFHPTNKTCLMFVRTQEVMNDDCGLGPREQLNQLTSHIDASNVYGSTKKESDALRDQDNPKRGQLKMNRHPYDSRYKRLLPYKKVKACRDVNSTIQCFLAGDGRVNEHVGLVAVHTLVHRSHNYIEEILFKNNPWGYLLLLPIDPQGPLTCMLSKTVTASHDLVMQLGSTAVTKNLSRWVIRIKSFDDQLREIRKFTLSWFFCTAMDHVESIQKYAMLQPMMEAFRTLGGRNTGHIYQLAELYRGDNNERRPCSQLPQPDFSKWIERRRRRYR